MYQRDSWFWEFYPPPYNFAAPGRFPPRGAVGFGGGSVGAAPGMNGLSGLGCNGNVACTSCSANRAAGLGDAGTFLSNLSSGNISDALMGNDFFASVPNIAVIAIGWWLFSKIAGDVGRTKKRVKSYSSKRKKRAALQRELEES